MMKKIVTTALTIVLALAPYYASAFAEDAIGYVPSLEGDVPVIRAGEQEKGTLAINNPIHLGDTILPAARSKVQILMEDDSLLNLGENARITIKEHMYQPEKDLRGSVYKLIRGKIRVVVGKLFSDADSRLEVETPTSIIGIRMTEFMVHVVSPELTVVITLDGEVIAKNIRADLICEEKVVKGYQSQIAKNTCPTAPTRTPAKKIEEILLETEVYMPPPTQEMPMSKRTFNETVQNALFVAPTASILGIGMMGIEKALRGGSILGPLSAEAANLQILYIEPGEVSKFVLPPVLPPLLPVLIMLPKPPPPPD